jgi:hypothetical protein
MRDQVICGVLRRRPARACIQAALLYHYQQGESDQVRVRTTNSRPVLLTLRSPCCAQRVCSRPGLCCPSDHRAVAMQKCPGRPMQTGTARSSPRCSPSLFWQARSTLCATHNTILSVLHPTFFQVLLYTQLNLSHEKSMEIQSAQLAQLEAEVDALQQARQKN